ncbi:unnamed protein product [Phytophthora fragariaefolia]|uniref:Unnamed protein product n=1 Tax=Phytophthora fragariaefolia TaxID=1490495 RepID=A0A9W6Y4Z3_9STRA|nr:unnamed protein product [Phytophthora fragariaefolia]
MNMSPGSPNTPATHVAREDCPHLADPEWEALQRLSTVIGEAAVTTMLRTLPPTEQHGVALGFIMKERREVAARATLSTPSTPRVESLKLHVNSYVGRECEPLLRWLVEVDTAITARLTSTRCRRLRSPCQAFADEQGVGHKDAASLTLCALARTRCLRWSPDKAFKPPQNEFRSRADFLDLQQGKHVVHAYAQRAREMVHLTAVPAEVTAKPMARLFVDMVFRHHGMPIDIVSDRAPRFTVHFWQEGFTLLGTQLSMSTADHPRTDGQTERVNRVLVDTLKRYAHSFHQWSDCLPMAEFAINNSVHGSTGHTPFYVNVMRHPRVPSVFGAVAPSLSGGGYPVLPKPNKHADMTNISAVSTRARTTRSPVNESTVSTPGVDTSSNNEQHVQGVHVVNKDAKLNNGFSSKDMDFVQRRQAVIRFVQDAIAASVDRQKLNGDNNGRGNSNEFKVGSLILLATQNLAKHAVSDFGASKLTPRFIGPFTVLAKHGNAYTLDIQSSMRLHPTFYVGRLKPYAQHESPSLGDLAPTLARARRRAFARHQLRPKVDLHVRGRLRDLRELGLQQGQLRPQDSKLGRLEAFNSLQTINGVWWTRPAAFSRRLHPHCETHRGNSQDRPAN